MIWQKYLADIYGIKNIPDGLFDLEIVNESEPVMNVKDELSRLNPETVNAYTYSIVNRRNENSLYITVKTRYGKSEEIIVHGVTEPGKGNKTDILYEFRSKNKFTDDELAKLKEALTFLKSVIGDSEALFNSKPFIKLKSWFLANLVGFDIIDSINNINRIVAGVTGKPIKYWLENDL